MPELLGPFSPDDTSRNMMRAGRILGFQRGVGCDDIATFKPVFGRTSFTLPMNDRLRFDRPLLFHIGDALNVEFIAKPGAMVSEAAEVFLVVEFITPLPPQ